MHKIAINEKLTLIENLEKMKGYEGSLMEMHEGSELSIIIMMPNIKEKEVKDLKNKKIKVKVLENKNMLVTYINFSGTPLIFELPFNPEKYSDNRIDNFEKSAINNNVSLSGNLVPCS